MTSSYNPSYFQGGQYDRNAPTGKQYQSSNYLNSITPISHQLNASPPRQQYGGYGAGLNILSPQSTYKQYQFGEFTSGTGAGQKDYMPPTSSFNGSSMFSYNKPFAPPSTSTQNGPVSSYLGNKNYVGSQSEGQFNQLSSNQGPKPFNDLDFELNKQGGANKYNNSGNMSMFNQKKYAFEQSSPNKSNYFNVDKYFENFKDPLENLDISAKTLPKSYGAEKSAPAYSNASTLQNTGAPLSYPSQNNYMNNNINKYLSDAPGAQTTFTNMPQIRERSEDQTEVQSRVIYDVKSNVPAFSQHVGESVHVKRDKNKSLVEYQLKNTQYNQPESTATYDNLNKSVNYLPQPSFNFSVDQSIAPQQKQVYRYDQQQQQEKSQQNPVNFDLTLPFAGDYKKLEAKKQQQQQQQQPQQALQQAPQQNKSLQPQQQQQQNFFKDYHEQKKIKTEGGDESNLFKSKEYYDQFISHQRMQKEIGFQQYQQNLQEQEFNQQLRSYLKQQDPQKNNILEQLEQKNNKSAPSNNNIKSQSVAMFEKIRSKMQSQAFLNKISNELNAEQVYFIKFLVEQITIDNELNKTRDNILKSTEFSLQGLFNFFDKKKKRHIDLNAFQEGLETLSIPYIKTYIQKIFSRFLQEDNKYLRYCDFVEIFAPIIGKQTMINQIFSFAGPKNGVSKEQRKQYSFSSTQNVNISEEQKKMISQLFSHLVNIEKSIQSFKDMQGDEEILLNTFKSLDKQQKGFLSIGDFLEFLNDKGGDYEREELAGVFKRINYIAHSGRINFHEFLTFLQRDPIVAPSIAEQKQPVEQKQKEEELKPIKILKEPNLPGFKKVAFKGKSKRLQQQQQQ